MVYCKHANWSQTSPASLFCGVASMSPLNRKLKFLCLQYKYHSQVPILIFFNLSALPSSGIGRASGLTWRFGNCFIPNVLTDATTDHRASAEHVWSRGLPSMEPSREAGEGVKAIAQGLWGKWEHFPTQSFCDGPGIQIYDRLIIGSSSLTSAPPLPVILLKWTSEISKLLWTDRWAKK